MRARHILIGPDEQAATTTKKEPFPRAEHDIKKIIYIGLALSVAVYATATAASIIATTVIQTAAGSADVYQHGDDNMADFMQVVADTLAESNSSAGRFDASEHRVDTRFGDAANTMDRYSHKYLRFGIVRDNHPASEKPPTTLCSGNGHAGNREVTPTELGIDDAGFGFAGCGDPSPSD